MKIQVLEPFSPAVGINYNVGDVAEVDDKTGAILIAAKRAVPDGEFKPFENFNPFAPKAKSVVTQVADAAAHVAQTATAAVAQTMQSVRPNPARNKRR